MKMQNHRSKLGRRLARLFVLLIAVPLIVTALAQGWLGREQILWTARTMERINARAAQENSEEFQKLGHATVMQSSDQARQVASNAMRTITQETAAIQKESLANTERDFTGLARRSLDGAMRQSLTTQRSTLESVRGEMNTLFSRSTRETQEQATRRVEKAMLDQVDTLMRERAFHLAQRVSDGVSGARNHLILTAQLPALRDGAAEGQKAILDALVRRFPALTLVTVLDKNGRETAISASNRVMTSADLSSHPQSAYFRAALKGQEYVAAGELPRTNGAPTLRLAVPIEEYRGKVSGVLAACFSLEGLWDEIRSTRIGKTGFAYVTDTKGGSLLEARKVAGAVMTSDSPVEELQWKVVAAVPREEAMHPIVALKADIARNAQKAMRAMSGNIESAAEGASIRLQNEAGRIQQVTVKGVQAHTQDIFRRLTDRTERHARDETARVQNAIIAQTAATQNHSDQQMMTAAAAASQRLSDRIRPMTAEALRRAVRRMGLFAFCIVLVSCLAGVLIATFTAGKIVRPVVDLAKGTQALAEGDLDRRIDENAPDEIGDLAQAFNRMAASLQESRSELNYAEAQLVQSAKLASLGTLSAGVAHELNQPIAIIRGLVQQMKSEDGLSEFVREDLVTIEGQTSRMVKIVNHLRTFSRAGKNERRQTDVNQVVQDCFILVGEQLRAHNIEIEFALCDTAPPVLADPNELEQVFLNLVTNSRDALEGRPDAKITLRSWVEQGRFVLESRDNGTGIPETVLPHIFDPFFTTKEPGKGTGLGLSISHNIIEKHQGQITAHNDGGAVFTITLPLAEESLPLAA